MAPNCRGSLEIQQPCGEEDVLTILCLPEDLILANLDRYRRVPRGGLAHDKNNTLANSALRESGRPNVRSSHCGGVDRMPALCPAVAGRDARRHAKQA